MAKPSVTRRLQQRTQTTMLRQVTETILPPASDFYREHSTGHHVAVILGSSIKLRNLHLINKCLNNHRPRFQGASGAGAGGAGGSSSARPSEVRLLTEIQDKFRRFVDEMWRFVDENWRF